MSDKHNKQPTPKGWIRASASPMRNNNPPRLMSPAPAMPRQRSPTPTFNARQLSETPTFNPGQHQSPTPPPPLRRMPPTPTGFTTVFESQRFSPAGPLPSYLPQSRPQTSQTPQPFVPMSPVNFPPSPFAPRPFSRTFSPAPTASTPCSIPPFSPPPIPQPTYLYRENNNGSNSGRPVNDYYVVPLEPANITKGVTVFDEEHDGRPSTADIIAQQSQDYVDEKLAEYQMTIALLQGKKIMIFYFHILRLTAMSVGAIINRSHIPDVLIHFKVKRIA
jgi:hypothetical protein